MENAHIISNFVYLFNQLNSLRAKEFHMFV